MQEKNCAAAVVSGPKCRARGNCISLHSVRLSAGRVPLVEAIHEGLAVALPALELDGAFVLDQLRQFGDIGADPGGGCSTRVALTDYEHLGRANMATTISSSTARTCCRTLCREVLRQGNRASHGRCDRVADEEGRRATVKRRRTAPSVQVTRCHAHAIGSDRMCMLVSRADRPRRLRTKPAAPSLTCLPDRARGPCRASAAASPRCRSTTRRGRACDPLRACSRAA